METVMQTTKKECDTAFFGAYGIILLLVAPSLWKFR
jgi:hypothetical protein